MIFISVFTREREVNDIERKINEYRGKKIVLNGRTRLGGLSSVILFSSMPAYVIAYYTGCILLLRSYD